MAGLHTLQLIFHCVPLGEFVIVVAYLYVGGWVGREQEEGGRVKGRKEQEEDGEDKKEKVVRRTLQVY